MDLYDIAIAKKLSSGGGGGGSSDFSNWIKCEVTQAMSGESAALKLDRKYNDIDNSNIYYIIPSESDATYINAPDIANKIVALLFTDYDADYGGYVGGYVIAKIDPTAGIQTLSIKIAAQPSSADDDILFVANV